jgi:hypothetical protein
MTQRAPYISVSDVVLSFVTVLPSDREGKSGAGVKTSATRSRTRTADLCDRWNEHRSGSFDGHYGDLPAGAGFVPDCAASRLRLTIM